MRAAMVDGGYPPREVRPLTLTPTLTLTLTLTRILTRTLDQEDAVAGTMCEESEVY